MNIVVHAVRTLMGGDLSLETLCNIVRNAYDTDEYIVYLKCVLLLEHLFTSIYPFAFSLDRLSKETTAINQIFGGFFRSQGIPFVYYYRVSQSQSQSQKSSLFGNP